MSLPIAVLAALVPFVAAHGNIVGAGPSDNVQAAPSLYGGNFDGTPFTRMFYPDEGGRPWLGIGDLGDAWSMGCEAQMGPSSFMKVAAGSSFAIQWEGASAELDYESSYKSADAKYPFVHCQGTVAVDMAAADANANPAELEWTRIVYDGLDPNSYVSDELRGACSKSGAETYRGNNKWGIAKMVEQGSTVYFDIPGDLAAGKYIVRNELASLHAGAYKPQLYVGCVGVEVTGSGTSSLGQGTNAGALYSGNGALASLEINAGSFSFNGDGPSVSGLVSGGSKSTGSSNNSNNNNNNSSGSDSSSGNSDNGKAAEPTSTPAAALAASPTPSAEGSSEGGDSSATCRRRRRRGIASRDVASHKRSTFPHAH
ncbi:lytic polysaccharide monooxygenase [Cylindrobasidium torrendii FP15055 ss-10]|uniref:lytic cellulose monooxygenase (C4-dehydrogenating) n=1 Tax=Cylindrobasidium torrendii FP15055 ss-10 TaxID=1314674 RepID=A0A0D7BAH8_9AGAR|nr:lytic polysaccharide monooxygenase [Cylindrobasidium torrendii FP15055 ss-10]